MNTYSIEPIGIVRSDLTTTGSAPRFHGETERETVVELDPAHAGRVRDVRGGDEILLVAMRPGRADGAATLAFHRARVRGVEAGKVRIAPIGEVDGTPVIEISTSFEERALSPRADPWKFTAPGWPSRYS